MARKRFVSPEFFKHSELHDAERASGLPLRIAFAGLWTVCDRRGLFTWRARELKLDIMPYDDVDFDAVLSALESAGFVECYEVDGKRYGRVPSLERWQSFHRNEPPSDVPEPSKGRPTKPAIGRPEPSNGRREVSKVGTEPSPSIAVTAVTAASTAAAGSSVQATAVPSAVDLSHDARLLTIAANSGLDQRYPNRNPLLATSGHAYACAEALRAAGVDVEFAHAAIHAYALTLTRDDPPRSLKYFTQHVLDRWAAESARRDAATYRPTTAAAPPEVDQMRTFAIRYAREGSAEWRQYCDDRAIAWQVAA